MATGSKLHEGSIDLEYFLRVEVVVLEMAK